MTELILYPEKFILPERQLTTEEKSKWSFLLGSGGTGSWAFNETGAYPWGIRHGAGNDDILQYNILRTTRNNVRVKYEVKASDVAFEPFNGGLQLYYGGTLGVERTVSGVYEEIIEKGTTDDIFGFIASATGGYAFNGQIKNVSIITTEHVDINQDLDLFINRAIKNPAIPSVIANDFCESFTLPGTHNNNDIFQDVYDFGLLIEFPINNIVYCDLLVDGLPIFKGVKGIFKLNGVKKIKNSIEYECEIYGALKTIFTAIGEKLLSELDLSEYDHEYNATNITDTWDKDTAGTLGEGYYYPIINYNFGWTKAFLQVNDIVAQGQLYPAIFVKQYIDSMFSEAGFTYTSTFFNTDKFKSLLIPYCNEDPILTDLIVSYIGLSSTQSIAASQPITTIEFDDETAPYSDNVPAGGSWSASHRFTVPRSGRYRVTSYIDYTTDDDTQTSNYRLVELTAGTLTDDILQDTDEYNFTDVLDLGVGQVVKACITTNLCNITAEGGSWIKFEYLDIYPGYTNVEISKIVPNMKCADLFMNIIKVFNLIILPSDTYNNYIIEPYIDYADTETSQDWTKKLALDKLIENQIFKDGLTKEFNFNFFDEKDEYYYTRENYVINAYSDGENIKQGSYKYTSINEILEDSNAIQLDFAVPILWIIAGYIDNSWIVPHMARVGSADSKTGLKPRMMYFHKKEGTEQAFLNGALDYTCATCSPWYDNLDQSLATNELLLFYYDGRPNQLFNSVTGNNLYNLYYKKFIEEIYNKDSRLITAYFDLSVYDFYNFSFDKPVFIDGLSYRVVDLNFNLNKRELTKVTLLKIANGIDLTYPTTYDFDTIAVLQNNDVEMVVSPPVVIPTASVLTLKSAPTVALPAKFGYGYDIISIVGQNKFNSAAYSSGTDTINIYFTGSGSHGWTLSNAFLESGADVLEKAKKTDNNEVIANADIMVTCANDPTLGDGEITLYFVYRLVKIK